MTIRPSHVYETGLFAVALPGGMETTIGWAEVELDVLDQPTMRMHLLVAEGFGSDDFHWNSDFGLRVTRVEGPRVELLVAEDGYGYRLQVGEASDDVPAELQDRIVGLDAGTSLRDVFALLIRVAAPMARFGPIRDEIVARFRHEVVNKISVDEALEARGREPMEPTTGSG